MLAADYLRLAAVKAEVLTITREMRVDERGKETMELHYCDKEGEVRRFGFHHLCHSLASFLTTKMKTDRKTVQRSHRHANSTITLDKYVRRTWKSLLPLKMTMLDEIFPTSEHQSELKW